MLSAASTQHPKNAARLLHLLLLEEEYQKILPETFRVLDETVLPAIHEDHTVSFYFVYGHLATLKMKSGLNANAVNALFANHNYLAFIDSVYAEIKLLDKDDKAVDEPPLSESQLYKDSEKLLAEIKQSIPEKRRKLHHDEKHTQTTTATLLARFKKMDADPTILTIAQHVVDTLLLNFTVHNTLQAAAIVKLYQNDLLTERLLSDSQKRNFDEKCTYILIAPAVSLIEDREMLYRPVEINQIHKRTDDKIEVEAKVKNITASHFRMYSASLSMIQAVGLSEKEVKAVVTDIESALTCELDHSRAGHLVHG